MGDWRVDTVLDVLRPQSLLLGCLWAGLAIFTLTLLVLMFTRLGQFHPLRKCLVLSLWAHLLLAGYSTTIHVSAPPPAADEPILRVTLADPHAEPIGALAGSPDSKTAKTVLPGGDQLWDSFAETAGRGAAPAAKPADLARADGPAQAEPPRRSAIESGAVPRNGAWDIVPLTRSDTPPPAIVVPTPPPISIQAQKNAEKIDAPAPQKRVEPRPMVKFQAAPARADTAGAASAAATRTPTAGLPADLFQQSLALPRVAATPGPPDPTGMTADVIDRKAAAAAISVAGPQPLDTAEKPAPPEKPADDGSADGAKRLFAAALPPSVAQRTPVKDSPTEAPRLTAPPVAVARRNTDGYQIPDAYRLRVAPDRAQLAQRYGATTETEAAVRAALRWLAGAQNADGRWRATDHDAGHELRIAGRERTGAGTEADTGVTGLALLALLASGQTHRDGPYKEEVRRGLEFLLHTQGSDGNLGGRGTVFEFMYCHAMATFAMSEALGMTGDPLLQSPVRRALDYTIRNQNSSSGGWRYQLGDPGDTSQLGWQFMALKSGELAGVPFPETTRQGILRFLGSVAAGKHGGLASYRPNERVSRAMSAEAILCWQLLGMPRNHAAGREMGDYLLAELPGDAKTNVYYWYYGTLAMYQLQGVYWTRWNEALRSALVGTQVKDGALAGSWDPDSVWGGYGGRVYSTALSALCLEIYYRFLPLYRETAAPETKAE